MDGYALQQQKFIQQNYIKNKRKIRNRNMGTNIKIHEEGQQKT